MQLEPRAWEWHCGAGLATQEALPRHCHRQLVVVSLTGAMVVALCRRLAVYKSLLNDVLEIVVASLHCSYVQSVPASNVRMLRCAFVRISCDLWATRCRKVDESAIISLYRIIDMNPIL